MSLKIARTILIVQDIFENFKEKCRLKGRTISTSIEDLIIDYLKQEGDYTEKDSIVSRKKKEQLLSK